MLSSFSASGEGVLSLADDEVCSDEVSGLDEVPEEEDDEEEGTPDEDEPEDELDETLAEEDSELSEDDGLSLSLSDGGSSGI